MRIKFRSDQLYESLGRNQGPLFKEGEVYDFTEDFAQRWIGRDVADEVPGGKGAVLVGRDGPFVPVADSAPKAPKAKAVVDPGRPPTGAPDTGAFKAGDVVRLKSGSPDLTVAEDQPEPGAITVTWPNDDSTVATGAFPADALELAPAA